MVFPFECCWTDSNPVKIQTGSVNPYMGELSGRLQQMPRRAAIVNFCPPSKQLRNVGLTPHCGITVFMLTCLYCSGIGTFVSDAREPR
ncbi:hypothetical protein M514_04795 [Trichuris suis]|uniref:Uncharacterized protein n=1 Tax=Trichuris suis TaxID=68888 RepID=A0A085NUP8_9BILA|nr:hypothetical protein M514_04795 [Trichuris suis]